MKQLQVYHVDAFTNQRFGGNAAGVVPDATGLSEIEMQNIARELNLSETAFLIPTTSEGQFRVRYFTPKSEIDFCGHATLGAAWLMATEFGWKPESTELIFETNVGTVPIRGFIGDDGMIERVFMRQAPPRIRHVDVPIEKIAYAIGMDVSELDPKYPIRLGYTGNWHLFIPVRSRSSIDTAQPRLTELGQMNTEQKAATTHLFTFAAEGSPYDIYTRDFAPAVGIAEDPVTGAANGALAGYLVLEGMLDANAPHSLKIAQGDTVGRPGIVYVDTFPGDLTEIHVGGTAVVTVSGQLFLD
ncbi:PhzF family phenazine biosynthesis protein [Alicyclobacillus fodiniaquatilis]|uniref:PhzF family phenazine biosynthesis protein n=1 Tax=Alicyclobacillus fodiniaquatilis TaxID=1661150 RepID=A0ABW4JFN7_9BACL